ncbi:MazG family protein [Pseudactinotalea sp. HY160]|uniref:MazG family protein n=1 Tax=Pseudactinotalea sp. HY160 TaxID=2654490 RepID=UPI00351B5EEC
MPHPGTLAALAEAIAIMDRLRGPGGCPWDREQTHASLAPYAIEEAYEVAEAAETGAPGDLADELGDLLLQVLFHARIATESGAFDLGDVASRLSRKLTSRHPHVFATDGEAGVAAAPDVRAVRANWDAIKASEPGREHFLDGIPASLPALARAQKILGRAERAGHDLPDLVHPRSPGDPAADDEERIGAELLAVVARARTRGVDAEAALRSVLRRAERALRAGEPRTGPTPPIPPA